MEAFYQQSTGKNFDTKNHWPEMLLKLFHRNDIKLYVDSATQFPKFPKGPKVCNGHALL